MTRQGCSLDFPFLMIRGIFFFFFYYKRPFLIPAIGVIEGGIMLFFL